ncbi:DUF2591 family protein [Paracidovorax citrulli]|uniref:DUF2591 domain-containing protein n=2 Tax=Paracidovorax citrulli TaxID=80869 RepID=A1TQP5_PARC0|nr:phage protein NinX family protein [Paracidovorax citrulli]ABM33283.1 conserved hypothetical protein [Paracidovorax citrulli AAC00-1]ATG92791.1 DUF2591 domain-containing protein [Paracidovorax citrulli]MVT28912.1 DUF2591 domain-containing protein [Paracidovorax citrulli]MVT36596.1 DUF2591 domain-containing protein [Paracidovorax citrulli]PVY62924.1 uncharacterized protein DUF2591 [Paracidovorax citrulli]
MRVSDLSGSLLDHWVAKAINSAPGPRYSSSWGDGGPLIDKHFIHVAPMPGKGRTWCAIVVSDSVRGTWREGPDPLVAGMRALVASKFGAEVPD